MPACLTHYTFATLYTPDELRGYFDVIALGTQGSDPYFYYGILPFWSGDDKKEIQEVGETVHHSEIGDHYFKMMQYALKSEKKEMLFAYLEAIWMHYCLDRVVHPYVFYRSGMDEDGHLSGFYKFSHGKFEAILDVFLAKKKKTFRKTSRTIRVKDDDLMEISRMWYVLHDTFPILKEDSFYKAAKAYKGVEGVLWTRTGLKRILFRLVGKTSLAHGMSYPKFYHRYDKIDILNDTHQEWELPSTGEKTTESMDDLFERAHKGYLEVHEILERGKKGEDVHQNLVDFVNKLDHDGAPYGVKMTHSKICW